MANADRAHARGRVRVEDAQKRVRVHLGGEVIADSHHVKYVWEGPHYPQYYFPRDDVRTDLLVPTGTRTHSASRGAGNHFTVKTSAREAVDAALQYPDSPIEALRDLVRFEWAAMDGWFEEDEEVFIHPRSPYTRIDILDSSRHVEVTIPGRYGALTVADTHHPKLLFETGLPARYYLPKVDVRMDLLVPTETETGCPYKGTARYWSVKVGEDVVPNLAWSYPSPLPESQKVAGLISFFNERVDLVVNGEPLERPRTPFS